jgi:hypothetical protein
MSDQTSQEKLNKPIDVDDLEDPNFDGTLPNGWEEEDVFAYDYGEFTNKHPLGSAKELEQMLRHKGLEPRKKLQADIKENPENWNALKRPASLHSASLILAEMLLGIPQHDRDQFHEIGDGHVYIHASGNHGEIHISNVASYALSAQEYNQELSRWNQCGRTRSSFRGKASRRIERCTTSPFSEILSSLLARHLSTNDS